ncbi:Xaa-Pro peptidase family protein [Candidatus Bathycorpusculum sp.]|uniref:M24 family metallopeptidase n=1 Tax=Candidatus Bathycorpusculum sp. TaxID=2994959 RepID=UPI002820911E|nr:Xaa-Pro peptidase family protein [Candidatus Termitimicrobium sp.]MCL2431479.1 Xaa-Pro peptidase family protein [Candidatus Termitimicrobium sp.]
MRIDRLKETATKQNKPDVFAVFNATNITYLTGFQGAVALLIPEQGQNVLFVNSVNYEQAKAEVKDTQVQLLKRGENIMDIIAQHVSGRLAVDTLSIESWRALAKAVGNEEKLESINQLIRGLRAVKDEKEIRLIREACRIADEGIKAAAQTIKAGVTEREVATEAEYAMRKAGSDGVAFETIAVCGVCCAYPHGGAEHRTISEDDFVIVDLGATHKFYRSDITRTFIAGKPNQKQTKIYETVKLAHQRALESIKPHVLTREADLVARQIIEAAGMGKFFVHNLGHGVGLEIHEAPILGPDSRDIFEVGNVVTNEPGVYVPGYGGVRIEDTVLVTENGAEKLTKAAYTL